MAKQESFAYAREVSDDSVGIAVAIQHGNDTSSFRLRGGRDNLVYCRR